MAERTLGNQAWPDWTLAGTRTQQSYLRRGRIDGSLLYRKLVASPVHPDSATYNTSSSIYARSLLVLMKVALVHDYLNQMGGAERVVIALHEIFPDAPIYTSIYDPARVDPAFQKMDIRTS